MREVAVAEWQSGRMGPCAMGASRTPEAQAAVLWHCRHAVRHRGAMQAAGGCKERRGRGPCNGRHGRRYNLRGNPIPLPPKRCPWPPGRNGCLRRDQDQEEEEEKEEQEEEGEARR
ncbi:unnamed protein product [Prorocentrum cordatum]|uniref:Uncharacterized protein n=1 Tax=Prorocentrum cordatum TaxID=2364126 RepID=A0ABN9VY13_9DINO|nr:unnamed protein product [Polarella glacialis]